MFNLSKSQSMIMKQITLYPKTDDSNRILQNMMHVLGTNRCTDICLRSLPITFILNDDVLRYMLSFCHTKFLFGIIYILNKKFKQIVMQIEDNVCKRKYSKIPNTNEQQRTFVISNIRKQRCNIEKNRNFLGPFNDIHDVIIKAGNGDRILIIHGGKYVIGHKRKYSEYIDKDLEIIGLTKNTNDIEIIINNVQVIDGNVAFKNVTLINTKPDESYFAVYPYGHMSVENCVFDFDNNGEEYILSHFVEVAIGAYFTAKVCIFKNVAVAIEIDNRAYEVVIKNCIFEDIWRYGMGSDSCIIISDNDARDFRMKVLRQLNYPDDLIVGNFSLKLHCEYNVFKNIDWKYPFMESLYYDTSNQNHFTIEHNSLHDNENPNDPNRIYQIQLPYSPYNDEENSD